MLRAHRPYGAGRDGVSISSCLAGRGDRVIRAPCQETNPLSSPALRGQLRFCEKPTRPHSRGIKPALDRGESFVDLVDKNVKVRLSTEIQGIVGISPPEVTQQFTFCSIQMNIDLCRTRKPWVTDTTRLQLMCRSLHRRPGRV